MGREIVILRRLDHPNIIKLEGFVVSRTSCSLYLVFEYMEHYLTSLAALSSIKFTKLQILFHSLFLGRYSFLNIIIASFTQHNSSLITKFESYFVSYRSNVTCSSF
ncbi:hypothetical protein T459_25636 [Capsicum annuum]|uniref:Protein kinase domain-containing protein n=1 Tax=Capsicum annuum TaxID=4072 RepID=A0A2G2YLA5_CAPAN|nr:hypothetical protein T459_25636 [Capsicum annuum]